MESNLTTPAIVIFTSADCADVWNDVLLGIEEEGIPFVIQENDSTDVIHICQPFLIRLLRLKISGDKVIRSRSDFSAI